MKLHPKTPISFVLALLLNIVLVVALEVALFYRIPMPLTPDYLASVDARYEDCRVFGEINSDSNPSVRFYRVQTQSGQTDIVPAQRHSFFSSRAKVPKNKILQNMALEGQYSKQLLFGTNVYTLFVSDSSVRAGHTGGGAFVQTALTKYMALGAVLAFAELLLLEKLRGN